MNHQNIKIQSTFYRFISPFADCADALDVAKAVDGSASPSPADSHSVAAPLFVAAAPDAVRVVVLVVVAVHVADVAVDVAVDALDVVDAVHVAADSAAVDPQIGDTDHVGPDPFGCHSNWSDSGDFPVDPSPAEGAVRASPPLPPYLPVTAEVDVVYPAPIPIT